VVNAVDDEAGVRLPRISVRQVDHKERDMLLDRLLVAYSYLPHHPGKGVVYDRLLPFVRGAWQKPRLRRRFGARFECELNEKVTRLIYYTGFDPKDCRIVRRLVRSGDVILDAGANVGFYSLLAAKWMRGNGAVHAFEPFPETARRFERNLELNSNLRSLVHLHRIALSDFNGKARMSVPDQSNQGCNHLGTTGECEVEVMTLDAFCEKQQLSRVDLIKIDVEGAEVALLKGAEQTIRRFRPILMIEVNPATLQRSGYTARDVIEAIGRHGYRMHYAGTFGLKLLQHLPVYGEEPNVYAFPYD
jgi:FkbM family methyltransferase